MKNVTILGAGLVGSLLAVYLVKRGYKVTIYERRGDMRKEQIVAGRSINLALSDRGWKGLAGAGLVEEIRKIAIPMHGRMIHGIDGSLSLLPYGKEGQFINSVSRGELNKKLMDMAEQNGVELIFNHRCDQVDLDNDSIHFTTDKETTTVKHQSLLFGADGAFSALRTSMTKHDRFEYSQHYIEHGYKELSIPPAKNGQWLMEKNALHIWPRKNFMLIALPNLDGSFTCTLFFQFDGELSFSSVKNENDTEKFFSDYFPDVIPLMPTYKKDFFANPTSSLVTIKCFPWVHKNKAALIGDAAHGIVPFYGQGMNAGFEDCTVLGELLNEYNDDWTKILPAYEQQRKPNTDAIAELALLNFIEMRDLVADKKFLRKKEIEKKIVAEYPGKYLPLYTMVTFSHINYADAMRLGKQHDDLLEKLYAVNDLEKKWATDEIQQLIRNAL
jgi:kynurenine 3-monooxygenase